MYGLLITRHQLNGRLWHGAKFNVNTGPFALALDCRVSEVSRRLWKSMHCSSSGKNMFLAEFSAVAACSLFEVCESWV